MENTTNVMSFPKKGQKLCISKEWPFLPRYPSAIKVSSTLCPLSTRPPPPPSPLQPSPFPFVTRATVVSGKIWIIPIWWINDDRSGISQVWGNQSSFLGTIQLCHLYCVQPWVRPVNVPSQPIHCNSCKKSPRKKIYLKRELTGGTALTRCFVTSSSPHCLPEVAFLYSVVQRM